MNKFIAKKLFLSSSLLSTTRYAIFDSKLEINTISHSKTKKELIAFDQINPEFEVQYRPNDLWSLLSLGFLISGFTLLSLSQLMTNSWENSISGLLILTAILSAIVGVKNQTVRYTFFFKNTQKKIFSIVESQELFSKSNPLISDSETFVTNLQEMLIKNDERGNQPQIQPSLLETQDDKFTFLKEKADDVFNYGLIDEITYNRMIDTINYKVFDIRLPQISSSNNVVDFQLVKILKESA